MPDRSNDWFRQAERDLAQAKDSQSAERHEWACFAAHQAAEKAVKALHLRCGQEAWGHVVAKLLADLPPRIAGSAEFIDRAHVLDGFYVGCRYPNGHPEGAPFEHYGKLQSTEAVSYADQILTFVRSQMARRTDSH